MNHPACDPHSRFRIAQPPSTLVPLLALAATLVAFSAAAAPGPASPALPAAKLPHARSPVPASTAHLNLVSAAWPAASRTTAHLVYYGGPVIGSVKVATVLWGSNINFAVASRMQDFYQQIVNSPAIDWLCEYDTNILDAGGQPGTRQTIRRGTTIGTFTIRPLNSATSLSDANIQSELSGQIGTGNLPAPDSSTVYMVHFPAGVTISDSGLRSCQNFCSYHSSFVSSSSAPIRYAVIPDLGSCFGACVGGTVLINATTANSWHELTEMLTDPELGTGWYDPVAGEISDICSQDTVTVIAGNGIPYLVVKPWSNAQGNCVISGPACASNSVADGPPPRASLDLASSNPFAGTVRLRLSLPANAPVDLAVYDVAGRRVAELLNGALGAGVHEASWNAGAGAASRGASVYFARLLTGGRVFSRTLVLCR
jgi:hypothetical protein